MYKQNYNTVKTLADQIVSEAQETGKTPSRSIKANQGLMSSMRRRTEEIATKEPTQEEIMAQYLKNAGFPEDFVEVIKASEATPRPVARPWEPMEGRFSDRDLLAIALEAEAGGEGELGMLAAGAVIDNRVQARGYGGNTFNDVILARGQFSAFNGITGYRDGEGALDVNNISPSETAYKVADQILSGDYESPVGGATHYYNPDESDPEWGQARAGGDWQRIGNHIFGYAD